VLLLHGQPGGARDWSEVLIRLSGRTEAIAIDRPGWDGRSAPADLEGNARAALAALDARGIERATIAGHSFGGAIAAWVAARHPSRVRALVLAAPAANLISIDAVDRLLAAPLVGPVLGAASLTGLGLALGFTPVRREIMRASGIAEPYLAAAGRALLTSGARRAFVAEQRWLLRDLPLLERSLPLIAAPTTILTGAEDRVVPRAAPRALANQIPGARLVVLEGAGHLLPQLHAHQLAEAIASGVQPGP
jgi:pimeloyl-ACP methyl ester carboxylesterase